MKKFIVAILVLGWLSIGPGCSNSASDNSKKETDVAAMAKPDVKCCFVSNDDGQQFFPASTAEVREIKNAPPVANLLCGDDAESPSTFTKIYEVGKGKLTLRISDFCVNPRKLELDYDRRYKNTLDIYPKDQQVRELNEGAYKGFAIFSPGTKSSYLHVLVDNRFSITIAGTDQSDMADIFKLFNIIPINKLAGFKK